jgi:hypothetical protein
VETSELTRKLLSMSLPERVAAVADDVKTGRDEFRQIDPHELAEILDVPQPEMPADCAFTSYAEIQSVEEYAEGHAPNSELVYLIEDKVSPERFQVLVEQSANLPDFASSEFDFLTTEERKLLEEAIALERLQSNMQNGMCCVARYSIPVPGGVLRFEGDIEDDGHCIELRTPYDVTM